MFKKNIFCRLHQLYPILARPKKFYMKKIYAVLILAFLCAGMLPGFAQTKFFADIPESQIQINNGKREIIPVKYRTVQLNTAGFKSFLSGLPQEASVRGRQNTAPVMELPMPDGSTARFHVWKSSVMEQGLMDKYPDIRTYAGQGIDDPTATIRFDLNPYFGFHAQILSAVSGRIYIDPFAKGNTEAHIVYYHADNRRSSFMTCETPQDPEAFAPPANPENLAGPCRGTELFTYRLAMACTGEYAVAVCAPAAPTVPATLAAMVTCVNRVTGVYENELSLRMVLIANNDLLIYLNGVTDPYTNNNGVAMLAENQSNVTTVIGSANYDIGHVVSTGGGGIASLRVPCVSSSKARGVTGLPNPVGDGFYIDYVAHEMGHQWGGNHTFASTTSNCAGNGNTSTAYEVGSGTTIQAYAGICGSDNIQPNSDPFFHAVSYDEIATYITTGNGNSCKVSTPTGNSIPQITMMENNGVTIPISTPFTLTAAATDPDNDALTYNWEQWDLGGFGTWNSGATSTTRPLFKSRVPKTSSSRTFPDIAVILAGFPANPAATMGGLKGETLPSIPRAMKFKLSVRDNKAGGGGMTTGGDGCQTGFTGIYQVNVAGTTPFTVSSPNGGESFPGASSQIVTWNVASTNVSPISTANVKISLSTDGGLTYPTVILASTPNDGTEAVNMPNTPTTTARIKVEAVGNIFFDISNANFTITVPPTGFSFNATTPATVACAGPASASVSLGTSATGGFSTPIVLTASGVPAGATVSFAPTPVTPDSATTVTLNNTQNLSAGTYNITVTGTAGAMLQTTTVSFVVSAGTPPTVFTDPASTSVCAGNDAIFTVATSGPAALGYQWQVSTNAGTSYTNIAGATNATYTVAGTTTAMNGNWYRVVVTGQCANATSAAAILTVQTSPGITTNPANAVECVGNNAVFSVVATGTGLTYQWQISTNGGTTFTDIPAATTASYTESSVTLAMNNNQYRVVITGTCPLPVTSPAATLSVGNAAAINTQPVGTTVCVGQTANFSVTASGSSLTYQWQVSTDGGTTWTNVTGAMSATLSLSSVIAAQNGNQYRVNVFSCTPTPITSVAVTLTVNTLIAVNTQPADVVLCAGGNASFSVAAVGTGAAYQWQVSTTGCAGTFTSIAGATTNTLAVNSTTAAQNGYAYRVVITGTCNTVTSSCAALTVNSAIAITTQPANTSACLPTQNSASFSVAVTGTAPTYQWQVSTNGGTSWTDISGATAATLTVNNLTAAMTGNQYRAVLNGTCTSNLNSDAATLTVNTLVNITSQPTAKSVCAGASTSFAVTATGSTITYQWQVSINGGAFVNVANGGAYSGATTATLNIANAGTAMNGYVYRVIVAGVPCGSVTSNTAALTVNALPNAVLVAAENSVLTPYINSGLYVTVSPVGSYSYQWFNDGFQVSGASGASLPVNVDGLGQYTALVTNTATGCSSTTNAVNITDSVSNMVFVYPNPNTGQFQVRYYTAATSTYSVIVYDGKGAQVFNKQFPVSAPYSRMDINLDNASAGIYMLEVRDAKGKRLASSSVIVRR